MALSEEWKQLLRNYRREHSHPVCKLTHLLGIPLIVLGIPFLLRPLYGISMIVAGVILQAIGHRFEGNEPQLLRDRRYARVGLIWWLDTVLRPTGLGERLFGVERPGRSRTG